MVCPIIINKKMEKDKIIEAYTSMPIQEVLLLNEVAKHFREGKIEGKYMPGLRLLTSLQFLEEKKIIKINKKIWTKQKK